MNSPASAVPAKPRRPRYPATVKRVAHITPRMVRVTFTSPELANFGWNGPAAHIKVIFADPATALAPGAEDAPRPTMRTYTPRRFDAQAAELDVDFVLHGEGPASEWASQVTVGQSLMIGGPGRNYVVDSAAEWFVLAGDDTSLPAISTILETLPASVHATVFVEVVDRAEEHELRSNANVSVTWLHRGEDPTQAGVKLEAALRDFQFPQGAGRVYVACESGAMRRIRRFLFTERNLPRDHVVSRGYWKLGATDHPDGDYGQDV